MKLFFKMIMILSCSICLHACATSHLVVATGTNISKYEYVVFGKESEGDRSLDDVVMMVQNEIANTRLKVVSASEGINLIAQGKSVLTPHINVLSEKWDGGHTYITINFYDYNTNQSVIVIKSSGIGLTISHDQQIAINSIKAKLLEVF